MDKLGLLQQMIKTPKFGCPVPLLHAHDLGIPTLSSRSHKMTAYFPGIIHSFWGQNLPIGNY